MPYPQRGVMNDPTIELSFWVGCDHNFFGINCSEFRERTDNSSGHYDCGPNEEIICLRGWTNPPTCLTGKVNNTYMQPCTGIAIIMDWWSSLLHINITEIYIYASIKNTS